MNKTPEQVRNELLLNYASLFEREERMFRLALLLNEAMDLAQSREPDEDGMATAFVMWDHSEFTVEYRTTISAGLREWRGDFWEIRLESGMNGWDYRAIFDHTHGNACEDSIVASIQIIYPFK